MINWKLLFAPKVPAFDDQAGTTLAIPRCRRSHATARAANMLAGSANMQLAVDDEHGSRSTVSARKFVTEVRDAWINRVGTAARWALEGNDF